MSEALLTVAEVARRLHCHPHTVRRWIWARKLHAVKVGDLVRIPIAEVERLLEPAPSIKGPRSILKIMDQLRVSPKDVDLMEQMIAVSRRPSSEYSDPFE